MMNSSEKNQSLALTRVSDAKAGVIRNAVYGLFLEV
jgi:hypothetical protein